MFKKFFVYLLALVILFSVVACKRSERGAFDKSTTSPSAEVQETGVVHDITEKNGQLLLVVPGDILLVKLPFSSKTSFQWSFREPITGRYLALKEHTFVKNIDETKEESEKDVLSIWRLKVLREGDFTLLFHYGDPFTPENPQEVFRMKIISRNERGANLPLLIMDSPREEQEIASPLLISGYAKMTDSRIVFLLKEQEGQEVIVEGEIPLKKSDQEYQYFEQSVSFDYDGDSPLVLAVSEKSPDGSERLLQTIPVRVQR